MISMPKVNDGSGKAQYWTNVDYGEIENTNAAASDFDAKNLVRKFISILI